MLSKELNTSDFLMGFIAVIRVNIKCWIGWDFYEGKDRKLLATVSEELSSCC